MNDNSSLVDANFERRSNGSIGIKNGSVVITDPSEGGSPALLLPGMQAIVKINGREIEGPVSVSSDDNIEITPRDEVIAASVQIEVSPDRMEAKIRISPRITITRKIVDLPEQEELLLTFAEEQVLSQEITAEDALLALKEKSVVFGLKDLLLQETVQEADDNWHIIARGREPVKGEDGYVELTFPQGGEVADYDDKNLARVDYKERLSLPSVEKGDILAVVYAPVSGKPGMLVNGDVVEPPEPKEARVQCKDGCKLIPVEKGTAVTATRHGRPLVEGKDELIFTVSPVMIHEGDVDLKSGNLRFKGDLKVVGNVVEGMTVECWGDLYVQGNVAGSGLLCGGSARFYNNVINSRITAGIFKDIYSVLYTPLKELEGTLMNLFTGVEQMEKAFSARGKEVQAEQVTRLIKLLLEKKFENIPELCDKILKTLEKYEFTLPSFFENNLREVCKYFVGADLPGITGKEKLIDVLDKVQASVSYAQNGLEIPGDLTALYVQNCRVHCSGNITVTGTGVYNSEIFTPRGIHIEGVFRGGGINAGEDIFVGEAGSPALPLKQGQIILTPDSTACFHKIYENVQVAFGKHAYKFSSTRMMVKVFYNKEDDLVVVENL